MHKIRSPQRETFSFYKGLNMSSVTIGKSALRDVLNLLRMSRRFGRVLPVLQIAIITLQVYDLYNSPAVKAGIHKLKKVPKHDPIPIELDE